MSMQPKTIMAVAILAASAAGAALAQQPAAPAAPPNPLVSANPTYATILMETTVNRPVADVWRRIGDYCAISEWLQIAAGCTITAGRNNEVGAVRSVASEVLVGKTEYSYTYTQPVNAAARAGRPYNLYHGTLEARAASPTTTRLIYTLMFDNSMLADDAARQADLASRRTTFERALANMKTLAEGGTLPPPPAGRGGGGGGRGGGGAPPAGGRGG